MGFQMPQACRHGSAQPTTEGVASPHPCWPNHAPDPLLISPHHESAAASGEEAAITSGPGRPPQMLVYPNPPCKARVTTASPSPPYSTCAAQGVQALPPICHVSSAWSPFLSLLWRHHLFSRPHLCFFSPLHFFPIMGPSSLLSHHPPSTIHWCPCLPGAGGSLWPQCPVSGRAETILSEMGREEPVWPLLLGLRHERLEGLEYGCPIGS